MTAQRTIVSPKTSNILFVFSPCLLTCEEIKGDSTGP